MILKAWSKIEFTKSGEVAKRWKKIEPINEICCDNCSTVFTQRIIDTKQREEKWGKQLCAKCIINEINKKIGAIGAKVLKSFSKEEKSKMCSRAGKISNEKCKNNKGRFTRERWDNMSKEQQQNQVKKANKGLHNKLNADEEYKRKHYLKVFKNSKIGFISKGHNELHEFLKEFNFIQHVQILDMEVDECNEDLKIVVEFNGDLYHCNPRKWEPTQYNSVIKMFAYEKWEKDRNRFYMLKKMGYKTFIVWEDDWALKRNEVKQKLINLINKTKNEIIKNSGNRE